MKCPYCNNKAPWVENKAIYGRNYGKSYMCYYCKPCDAYVGCHQNTKKPLGTMANEELRLWRKTAHAWFDPLWKEGKMTRKQAYRWLYEQTGEWIHMGESDIEKCQIVINKTLNY